MSYEIDLEAYGAAPGNNLFSNIQIKQVKDFEFGNLCVMDDSIADLSVITKDSVIHCATLVHLTPGVIKVACSISSENSEHFNRKDHDRGIVLIWNFLQAVLQCNCTPACPISNQ